MTNPTNSQTLILNYLKQHKLAVISAINQRNQPQSAIIGFGESDKVELIFGTSNLSRKYRNLQTNRHVSFALGGDDGKTVQYEGTAKEIAGDEAKYYFAKTPTSRQHENLGILSS